MGKAPTSRGSPLARVISRPALYTEGSPFAALDFQETYLRTVFAFLGVTDVQVVRAEGLALGPEQRQAALQAAPVEPAGHRQ